MKTILYWLIFIWTIATWVILWVPVALITATVRVVIAIVSNVNDIMEKHK